MKNPILLLFTLCLTLFGCDNTVNVKESTTIIVDEQSQPAVDTTTRIRVVNETDKAVVVWLSLGATNGCLQNIGQVPFITDSVAPLKGYFTLAPHDSTIDYAPDNMGYNGEFSFDTVALTCAIPRYPFGINIFEFIVNISNAPYPNPQETVEISCVDGANCIISGKFLGGEDWNASSMYPKVDSIWNKGIRNNSGQIGVFPFGCDDCTSSVNPPCGKNDKDKQKYPICTVQRNAIGSGGGIIRVSYKGSFQILK
jgi:hypothetical protein